MPSGVSIASAWNGVAVPPSSAAAHTATAVPDSISRPPPSTPPAPQPTSVGGSRASATPSSAASGAAGCAPAQKRKATSALLPPSAARACVPASIAATLESGLVDSPQPMRTLTLLTILRGMAGGAAGLAIFGPTGVGKAALAFALADRLRARGERPVAVSADALQVYRGLETLTGVPPAAEQARLEHRLGSILPVHAPFSAGEYAQLAHAEIDGLLAAGARPIVVGGTGLYLRAALADLGLRPSPPGELRARLEAELEQRGPEALHERLAREAPWTGGTVAPRARSRIVRALELLELGELEPPAPGARNELWTADTRHPTRLVGLVMDRAALYARIDARVDAMVAAGAIDEVRAAHAAGASETARKALGFEELLAGDVEAMKRRTRNFAKRQLTWMRKLAGVEIVDVTGRPADDVAGELLGGS